VSKFTVKPVPEDVKEELIKASQEIANAIGPFIEKYDPWIILSSINYMHAHAVVFLSKDNAENIETAKLAEIECLMKAIDQFNPFREES
jgi:hypothetical protein